MHVAIFGGNGKVARLLTPLLVGAGHEVTSFIRKESQVHAVGDLGANPVLLDVEHASLKQVTNALAGCDAVIWSAGAGGGDPARTRAVDRDAAVRAIDAAEAAGVRRFILVSFSGADRSRLVPETDPFHTYMLAKIEADEHLMASGLDWTILAPGPLTLEPSNGVVNPAAAPGHGDTAPRELVAQVAAAVLDDPHASHQTLIIGAGHVPIDEWLESLSIARA